MERLGKIIDFPALEDDDKGILEEQKSILEKLLEGINQRLEE